MMEHTPIKFRILEYLDDNPDSWTDEVVPALQGEYGMTTDYGRDMINYDLVELVSAGLVHEGESKIDEDGHYKQNSLITQYCITNLGKEYLSGLMETVTPKEK